MRYKSIITAVAAFVILGCAPEEAEPAASPLEFSELNDDLMVGTMLLEDIEVAFSVRQTSDQVFALEVRYGDVTFTGESDYNQEIFLLDGFVTATGADIVINDDDLLIIQELGQALSDAELINSYRPDVEHQRGVVLQTPGGALARALSVWVTRGVSESPEHAIKAEHGRTITYLCSSLTGYGIPATHDCWDCWSDWDGWSYVNIGPQGGNNCYADSCAPGCSNSGTNQCGRLSCEQSGGGSNGSWQWGSNSDKYGACTVWDTNAYTQDCLNHDHCVRNDHSTGSSWCSDDAVPAGDDQASGRDCIMNNGCAGNCGGFSGAGQCYCDASCETYGDCCMDKRQQCG
jgi:hypothetical protein